MNCKSCGQALAPGVKFCDKCGTKIETASVTAPVLNSQPSANTNLAQEISGKAKITAILAMVVSGLNIGILLILALLSEKIDVNWLVVGVQGILLIVLSIFGFILYGKINNIPEVKNLIRFRLFPVMAVIMIISLLSGGGGVGILPLLILIFGSQTIQKIAKYEKNS